MYKHTPSHLCCQGKFPLICKKCGEAKKPEDFYSGNKYRCKECAKRESRTWYKSNSQRANKNSALWQKNNPERVKELRAKHIARRRADPNYKEKQAKFYREWYDKNGRQKRQGDLDIVNLWKRLNPKKCEAHWKLNDALEAGKVIKPLHCSKCGSGRKILGHHEDYELPLEVEWLCYSCHKKLDHSFLPTAKSNTIDNSLYRENSI